MRTNHTQVLLVSVFNIKFSTYSMDRLFVEPSDQLLVSCKRYMKRFVAKRAKSIKVYLFIYFYIIIITIIFDVEKDIVARIKNHIFRPKK